MNYEKSELMSKLNSISVLHRKRLEIEKKMDKFKPIDSYERSVVVPAFPGEKTLQNDVKHSNDSAIENMRKKHNELYAPKAPKKPEIKKFEEPKMTKDETETASKNNTLGAIGIFLTVLLGFISAITCFFMYFSNESLLSILIVAAFPAIGICLIISSKYKKKKFQSYLKKKREKAFADYNLNNELLMSEYNKAVIEYENALKTYNVNLEAFLEKYKAWREIYLKKEEEERRISALLEQDRMAEVDRIREDELKPIEDKLWKFDDILSYKYWGVADDISDLIMSGRADSVKEAINLYETQQQIQLQQQQIQLQREEDEKRQREAMLYNRIEERRKQEEEERATLRQCNSCALSRECRLRRPNCASYKPR